MADETTPTPAANGGTPTQGQPATPSPAPQPPAGPEPYRTFATEADLTKFVQKSKTQAERAALRKLASDLGFEDADELREALEPLRRGQGGSQSVGSIPQTPAVPTQESQTARWEMALSVAEAKGLPVTLVKRLQGNTQAEMEADADRLLALIGNVGTSVARAPGIPPAPQSGQPVTFTRTQLQDPKFVRENRDAILRAGREGRIVNS